MKKTMRRNRVAASMMAILMMVMSMTMFVSAAETREEITESGAKIIIQNTPSDTAVTLSGKSFDLYAVFDVTVVRTTDEESNVTDGIEYSVNEDFKGFFDGVLDFSNESDYPDGIPDFGTDTYNTAALEYVNTYKVDDSDNMQSLVTLLREYVLTTPVTPTSTTTSTAVDAGSGDNLVQTITSDVLQNGYYLVVDSEATTDETGLVPAGALVNVPARETSGTNTGLLSANAVITMKGSMPTMNKEVWHDNIANVTGDNSPVVGTTGSWDVVADYEIGDTVEYRITATIPSDLSAYTAGYAGYDGYEDAYAYIISDTLSSGITFNNDIEIYTDAALTGDPVAGNYHKTVYGTEDGDPTFTITFDMVSITNDPGLQTVETFYIYYTGTVTADALVADDYEDNVATLTYGNDPYDSSSVGTIVDGVQTYTFDLEILKTEGDGSTPLAGARFALYSITGEGDAAVTTQIYLAQDTTAEVPTYYPATGNAYDTEAGSYAGTILTDSTGVFHIVGLDDATEYKLKEIVAPTGFNAADSIYFTITAKYAVDYTVESYGVSVPTITTTGGLGASGNGLSATIINTSSTLLPTTGGMGTQLFMIIGGTMMLGAVVLLVGKRRKER